jgi:hypothetical protein
MFPAEQTRETKVKATFILLIAGCLVLFAIYAKTSPISSAKTPASSLAQAKIWADPNNQSPELKIKALPVTLLSIFLVAFFILKVLMAECALPSIPSPDSRLQHLYGSSQHWLRPPPSV